MASDEQQVEAVTGEQQALQSRDSVERHKQRASAVGHHNIHPPTLQEPSHSQPGKACLQCRSRKRRCDGQKPRCANCVSRQVAACQYPRVQKRRGAGKRYVSHDPQQDRVPNSFMLTA
ncbi:hypothetical protein C8A01DRAFT_16341 [Parachaetomium inaequale]|uniref:Zn(2)-C6 fungal-type domain-containing protein n=1 Tax=Parachaetomium inaequale TaxID=2588326 RepID=A0AAN6SRC0_9PEZI|nr:hypothetical protein C8A01DRAFT_16341 [Parachaetomium inaequale]